jgi:hypothetical protein
MDSFPVDFTAADMDKKCSEMRDEAAARETANLRKFIVDLVTRTVRNGFVGVILPLYKFSAVAINAVIPEMEERFPGRLYYNVGKNEFRLVTVESPLSYEYLMIIPPDYNTAHDPLSPDDVDICCKRRI